MCKARAVDAGDRWLRTEGLLEGFDPSGFAPYGRRSIYAPCTDCQSRFANVIVLWEGRLPGWWPRWPFKPKPTGRVALTSSEWLVHMAGNTSMDSEIAFVATVQGYLIVDPRWFDLFRRGLGEHFLSLA